MSYFHDDTPLNQISIPGTHDSSTFGISGPALVVTQNHVNNINKQLTDGIRFIDARCRHIENVFAMHHDRYYLNHMFGDVLNACYSFLAANPSECIIISVKPEYDESKCSRGFAETFEKSYYNKDHWYVGNQVPKLGEIRGKIVLISRFAGSSMGIHTSGWKDNGVSDIAGFLHIQDKYNEHNEVYKWHAIRDAWNFSASNNRLGWLTLNFTSIAGKVGTSPYEYAVDKNPELANYIIPRKEAGGIVISDYYYEGRITQKVIKTNFRDI
ncbi:1-phosphatidylinositol phosphodiesterase [Rahnella sp. RcJ3]|nr:1-phosphatidylinositol phosphodiesterase [Rahnella sp. RcJ3]